MKARLLAVLVACGAACLADAQAIDLSAAAASELRAKVDLVTWDDGGAISNFVYRHPSEVFPAAVVKRAGAVRELPVRLREDVAQYRFADGRTLQQYVDEGEIGRAHV